MTGKKSVETATLGETKDDHVIEQGEAIDESRLEKKIHAWLKGQGFPLEMRVAQAFHKDGFMVEQSSYYTNEDQLAREVDICANLEAHWGFLGENRDGIMIFEMFVVTECKSGAKALRPWIVFSSPNNPLTLDGPALARFGTPIAKAALDLMANDPLTMDLDLFRPRERYGYQIVCAPVWERSNEDLAYSAITSLVDAAAAYADPVLDGLYRHCRITLPLLVVGTPLYECWLENRAR